MHRLRARALMAPVQLCLVCLTVLQARAHWVLHAPALQQHGKQRYSKTQVKVRWLG
jgi:hypothetical protein